MPRYVFRIQDGSSLESLEMVYPNPEAMRPEAVRLAGESIRELGRQGESLRRRQWVLQVKDDSDNVVFFMTVEMNDTSH